ncbi:MAG: hypothetical protein GXP26_02070 [Planctomycetes bacterium]|nr:hypothetical protein [Planctomycetota bacterium]
MLKFPEFRFSLRQLFLLTTALGIGLGIVYGIGAAFFLPYIILVMLAAFYMVLLDTRITILQRLLLVILLAGLVIFSLLPRVQ